MKRHVIPIRVKLLLAVLAIVMLVVTLITVTMANLFHEDKTTYVRDLTALMAVQISREASVIVESYTDNLAIFANALFDARLSASQKQNIIQNLFASFGEFVAVSVVRENDDPVTVYDAATLRDAGIAIDVLHAHHETNPPPFDRLTGGTVHVSNATFNAALPTMTVTVAHLSESEGSESARRVGLVGFVRLDRLMELASRSTTFDAWITDSDGRLIAHSDRDKVLTRSTLDAFIETAASEHALSTTRDFERDGEQYIGGFAYARLGGMKTGIEIPRSAAYLTARRLLTSLVVLALILFSVATLVSLFMAHGLTRPLDRLAHAARKIGQGNFDVSVHSDSADEIGLLADSFNQMTGELKHRDEELGRAHAALVQSEKMAAFGQLGAGIAHEVKNPLAGILGYAQLALRKVPEDSPLHKHLNIIEKETKRCTEIIANLLKFARQEKAEQKRIDINEVVNDALDIVDHQLRINQVTPHKDLESGLPPVYANANQLQQVLLNFAVNAQQAMAGTPGEFHVTTHSLDDERIEIRVRDTGPGMPAEVRERIFEPFFTTKPAGEGTGLGLSVTYGIIRDHGGDIVVDSEPGEGTTFILTLPVAGAVHVPSQQAAAELSAV